MICRFFFHSVGCLFILLMLSYAVQKTFIRSCPISLFLLLLLIFIFMYQKLGIVDRGCLLLRSVVSFTRQNRIHIFLCISSISAFIRHINFDKLDSFLDFWTGFPRLCFYSGISWRIEQIVASALSRQQKGDQNYPEWIGTRPSQLPQPWMATGCTGMTF